jgi:Protein of unknown function (DUF3089)
MKQDLVNEGRITRRLSGRRTGLVGAAGLLIALSGSFESRADSTSPNTDAAMPADYSDPAHWLCRPGRADACAVNLDATIIAKDGSTTREAFRADPDPAIDCFYAYPTVSMEATGNADFAVDRDLSRTVVQQFARFGARCRLFAPVYREVTLPALISLMSGKPMPLSWELAYADVLAAWKTYLANDNQGRGFVLVGHSQGAGMLARLIKEEIDGEPIQSQMVSALLLGQAGFLPVKPGAEPALVFPHIPLCRASAQIGCVISYSSFRAETPPAAGSLLEKAPEGMVPSCANPAALEGGSGPLDAYLSTLGESINYEAKEPISWTDPPRPIETPFVKVPGLLSARCVEDGHVAYLAVTRDTSPGGRRVSDIKGDSIRVPAFGLHQIDANLTMGNLLSIVADETHTYLAQSKKN